MKMEGGGRGGGEGMGVGFGVGDVCGVVRDGMGWDETRSISYNFRYNPSRAT